MMEDAQKSIEAGCNGHLTKPINKQEFMAALERFGHQAQGGTA
jgi:CheY-like chemotaxis protein